MYTLDFDDDPISFLATLPKELRKRVFDKIVSTKESPFRFFERLKGRTDFKLRVGDYRVIADIRENKKIIVVTLIGHRKNIYKNLK
jgi:mRNA interferase RelE/StbE